MTIPPKMWEQFAKSGPWALLAFVMITAAGFEMHYFVSKYIDATGTTIAHTTAVLDKLADENGEHREQLRSNADLVRQNGLIIQKLAQMMEDAHSKMSSAVEERKKQTALLEEISKELKAQH